MRDFWAELEPFQVGAYVNFRLNWSTSRGAKGTTDRLTIPLPRSAGEGLALPRNNVSCSWGWCPSLDLGGSTDPTTQVRVCRRT